MFGKLKKTVAAAFVCCMALNVAANADSVGGAVTNTDVRLRTGAGTEYSILSTLPENSAVIVEQDLGTGWYQVNVDGTRGFMSSQYMTFYHTMDLNTRGYINGNAVRIRSDASMDSSVLDVMNLGAKVDVIGVANDWYKIRTSPDTEGYVHSAYVVLAQSELKESSEADSIGQQIVELAEQYLGYPYVWAGSSPSTGFDCSGFVSYVFKSLGYKTDRTAADIYSNGTYVEKEDLQPGDAVFFSSGGSSIGHIGIYIGDGEFIHSSSGCGYVTITDLNSNYYSNNYVGARRLAE